jgi:hypothetical protein
VNQSALPITTRGLGAAVENDMMKDNPYLKSFIGSNGAIVQEEYNPGSSIYKAVGLKAKELLKDKYQQSAIENHSRSNSTALSP